MFSYHIVQLYSPSSGKVEFSWLHMCHVSGINQDLVSRYWTIMYNTDGDEARLRLFTPAEGRISDDIPWSFMIL